MIQHLLFQPIETNEFAMISTNMAIRQEVSHGTYLPVDVEDRSPLTPEEILMLGRNLPSKQQPNHDNNSNDQDLVLDSCDAHDESDGEVGPQDDDDSDDEHYASTVTFKKRRKMMEPPEAVDLAGVAVDWLVLILLSLFFFTLSSAEGGEYVDGMPNVGILRMIALIAAPVFPLLLFIAGCIAAIFPWKDKRSEFWKLISLTVGAPIYRVTFRDGLIGDIITSNVRPMRDIAFTFFYIFSGLQGWWKQQAYSDDFDTTTTVVGGQLPMLETNWFLHTIIFPACMVSPLWWRFLQTLRQSYESKQRWPYLGNAMKYFFAAEVAIYGAYNPSQKDNFLWISCFVIATLYQIWWDIFMDWELLIIDTDANNKLMMKNIRLRKTRIYSVEWMYWTILIINILFRFCWTLSFLPPHYLNRAGVLSDQFEGDTLSHILNPTIASAEIIRRTLWGFLRVELEAIKEGRKDPTLKGAWSDPDSIQNHHHHHHDETEMKDMTTTTTMEQIQREGNDDHPILDDIQTNWISSSSSPTPTTRKNELHFLAELCLYATAFTALGLIAAAHRITF